MTLLSLPALLLLAALGVLLWLALQRREPARLEVGTLLLWRRVAQKSSSAPRSRRRLEPLLWLLLVAAAMGALGAARPAMLQAARTPRVAVFIERAGAGDIEPALAQALDRARALAKGSELEFYMPLTTRVEGAPDGLVMLSPGAIEAELAQFERRTAHADQRLLLLCTPHPAASRIGVVANRVTLAARGVMYQATVQGSELLTRSSPGPSPQAQGLTLIEERDGGEVMHRWAVEDLPATLTDASGHQVRVVAMPFVVAAGNDWASARHQVLLAALGADAPGAGNAQVWLGDNERAPAIRINQGEPTDTTDLEVSYDPAHSLFDQLPLGGLNWAAGGRVMTPQPGRRALVTGVRDGAPVGDLVTLDASGRVLRFAGDPFSIAPVQDAALLLDNSVGVVTGRRPSAGDRIAVQGELPSARAAHAKPFTQQGTISAGAHRDEPREWTSWVLALSACAALAAALLSVSGPRQP